VALSVALVRKELVVKIDLRLDEYSGDNHFFLPLSINRNNGLKEPVKLYFGYE